MDIIHPDPTGLLSRVISGRDSDRLGCDGAGAADDERRSLRNKMFELHDPDPDVARDLAIAAIRRMSGMRDQCITWEAEFERRFEATDAVRRLDADDEDREAFEEVSRMEDVKALVQDARILAEELLMAAVLILHGRINVHSQMKDMGTAWAPAAFELDGQLFVVSPREEDERGGDCPAALTVVDVKASWDSAAFES